VPTGQELDQRHRSRATEGIMPGRCDGDRADDRPWSSLPRADRRSLPMIDPSITPRADRRSLPDSSRRPTGAPTTTATAPGRPARHAGAERTDLSVLAHHRVPTTPDGTRERTKGGVVFCWGGHRLPRHHLFSGRSQNLLPIQKRSGQKAQEASGSWGFTPTGSGTLERLCPADVSGWWYRDRAELGVCRHTGGPVAASRPL
jgi:hypothetical protein